MYKAIIFLFFGLLASLFISCKANYVFSKKEPQKKTEIEVLVVSTFDSPFLIQQNKAKIESVNYSKVHIKNSNDSIETKPKSKLAAVAFAITLGPFGMHRIYLGTSTKVPVAYTLTLGGGFFVLPIIDVFYILLSTDPSKYENNGNFFIWNQKE